MSLNPTHRGPGPAVRGADAIATTAASSAPAVRSRTRRRGTNIVARPERPRLGSGTRARPAGVRRTARGAVLERELVRVSVPIGERLDVVGLLHATPAVLPEPVAQARIDRKATETSGDRVVVLGFDDEPCRVLLDSLPYRSDVGRDHR